MQRYLDAIESELFSINYEAQFTLEYTGELKIDVLRVAFKILCARNPVLRARITTNESRHILRVESEDSAEFLLLNGGLTTLLSKAATPAIFDLSNRTHNGLERRLTRLIVVQQRKEEKGFVTLGVDHTVIDGRSLPAILRELWQIYTDLSAGRMVSTNESRVLPAAPTTLLSERWGEIERIETTKTITDMKFRDSVCRYFQLDVDETRHLRAVARADGMSVGGLLVAEMVRAVAAHAPSPKRRSIKVTQIVDIRNHVSPRVRPTETTYLCGQCTVSVRLNLSRVDIYKEWKRNLLGAIRNRQLLFHGVSLPGLADIVDDAEISFNNVGVFPSMTFPKSLHAELFELRFRYEKNFPLPENKHLAGYFYTNNGKIHLYLFAHPERELVAREFEGSIREAANVSRL